MLKNIWTDTEKPILIASSSSDEHAYAAVATILENKGYPVIIYQTDKVMSGEEKFSLTVDGTGEHSITYNDRSIHHKNIGAAWYRKIANFHIPDADQNIAKQLHISNEVRHLHDTIWPLIPDHKWLNPPDAMRRADRKIGQLILAQDIGFNIPHTIISNDWNDIGARLLPKNEKIIVKMIRGVIAEKDVIKGMYTSILDKKSIKRLEEYTNPFLGIYQPFIDKAREWRVTAVGDNVFPAAIYTRDDAKDDWRKHQVTSSVTFKSERLPDGIDEKCHSFLGRTGLKFGAFDFIEKSDGEIIFLECNPNGQYGWLEDELGFPISQSIAAELMKIVS